MTKITRRSLIVLLTVVLLVLRFPFTSHGQSKFVTRPGKEFISPEGRPLLLKGINLGNWLLPEGYMFKFKTASSPRLIQTVLNELVGEDEARRFWKAFRENYISKQDIRFIKQSGFNSVGTTRHIEHGIPSMRFASSMRACVMGPNIIRMVPGVFLPVESRFAPLAQDLVSLAVARPCVAVTFCVGSSLHSKSTKSFPDSAIVITNPFTRSSILLR